MEPLFPPKQLAPVLVVVVLKAATGWETAAEEVVEHKLASVMVTL